MISPNIGTQGKKVHRTAVDPKENLTEVIRKAIKAANGDLDLARDALVERALQDRELLLALTRDRLDEIVMDLLRLKIRQDRTAIRKTSAIRFARAAQVGATPQQHAQRSAEVHNKHLWLNFRITFIDGTTKALGDATGIEAGDFADREYLPKIREATRDYNMFQSIKRAAMHKTVRSVLSNEKMDKMYAEACNA